jgi:hypothetical protein
LAELTKIRYTVLWRNEAESQLAEIWCDATNRAAISAAADQIDNDLGLDAHEKGDPSLHGARSLSYGPIVVDFRVDEGDRKVLVEGVRLA